MSKTVKNYLDHLIGSYLEIFGIFNQALEISFNGEIYKDIRFNIQCKIETDDKEITEHKAFFDQVDSDSSNLIYFIKANDKKVTDYSLSKERLVIVFENQYKIFFDLYDEYGEPLNIVYKKSIQEKKEDAVIFFENDGEINLRENS
jgi:hypothetical protein